MTHVSPAPFGAAIERTRRLSRYVAQALGARPDLERELQSEGSTPFAREAMRSALEGDPAELSGTLRQLRERVMVRLAYRDLNGLAPLAEVFATMDALAEECIRAALERAEAEMRELHGEPAAGASLTVVALGKLGGGELNVSSDVDLVFVYGVDGETAGPRAVTHGEHFAAVGRRLIALLSEITPEGQCFRVDMRLRPFGDSGPLAGSLTALEDYFVVHARPWERYAWLKARVVAGPPEGVRERVDPFVYRRYLDYGMLAALRELHARIFEAAIRRRKTEDIKVGAGGIREIEFCAQLFQMVRGGRDAALRTTSTRAALAAIARRGLLDSARVAELEGAYEFLRRLEHRLQYLDDRQTQALPKSAEDRALVAEAMDCTGWDELEARLDAHRGKVKEIYGALFETPPAHASAASLAAWLYDPQGTTDLEGLTAELAEAGIVDAGPVARRLAELTRSRRYRGLSASTRAQLERLLAPLVAAIAREGGREATAARLLDILEAIGGREAYYTLLLEHPIVLDRAARLAARSAWAARLIARHPILLDELTRAPASYAATDWVNERAELALECAALRGDVERLLDHLRHYKQRQVLRFTIADLEGELPVMALSDELAALADTLLDVALAEAARIVKGADAGGDDAAGFCIAAYGKLGGKELGYGSDLDVIFLYDEARGSEAERFARIAQRLASWVTSFTPAGILYEMDLRLRPDGASGLLVSSLSAFREYQATRAWTWEHQALTRARACAGDVAVGERFERVRDEILAMPRDRAKLFAEIAAMRQRMRRGRDAAPERGAPPVERSAADSTDLKHVPGGMIDLEFCVQALVLADGPAHPELRENRGNHTLLHRAAAAGLVDGGVASEAAQAYLTMRQRQHEAALNDEERVRLSPGELESERAAVRRLWDSLFGVLGKP